MSRNDPCPCGSGRRYKHCCGVVRDPDAVPERPAPEELETLIALINHGRSREAEDHALSLLAVHPGTGMVWKILSVALVRQGKNALPALRKAAQLMPRDAEALANLGSALLAAGQWAEALANLRAALEQRPDDADTLVEAGDAARALGRAEEAIRLYERALRIDPHSPQARNNLGNACVALGRLPEAVECYRLALERRPDDTEVLSNLADALRQCGEFDEAVRCSERAIALAPSLARAHNILGLSLAGLGQRESAVARLRRALALDPRSVEALTNLASVLRELGERGEAVALCRQAVELDPRRAESHCGLGHALFDLRRLEEAADSFRRALALRPVFPMAQVGLGAVLRVQGRADQAEASGRAALACDPNNVEALVLLGELQGDRGRFAEAEELLERALGIDARCTSAYCSIAAHRRMTSDDTAWLAGVHALLGEPLPLRQGISLRYALGKYFDDIGQYDRAFGHYREANELTRRYGSRYDGARLAARVDRLVGRFDVGLVRALHSAHERQSGPSSCERPVFIIGMPRSGTSLAEQILASHPEVFGAGEVRFWDDAFARFEQENFEADLVPQFVGDYLARLSGAPASASRVIDKMPANFFYAGLIHAAFPRARIIHMRRDPIDTCLSIYFQNFFNMSPYAHDLEDLAHYYAQYARVTGHWRAVLPATALLEVRYEELVTDPEGATRRMLSFIGLPWDPRCLEFHRTARSVITASRWQVRQRIHAASVGRWRKYQKHVAPLLSLQCNSAQT